ncbi:MAG: hypothetical protein QM758_01150 [Armatimonas sp.]
MPARKQGRITSNDLERLQLRKKFEEEDSLNQRNKHVKISSAPMPFREVVRELCKQAGQAKVVIEPGIGGIVSSFVSGSFEELLQQVCKQATPMAYPIWKGGGLRIVPAPEPGKFDQRTGLYRLLGHPKGEIYLEEKDVYSTGENHEGIAHHDAFSREQAQVTVTYQQSGKPAKGIIIAHETHDRVSKDITDSRGRCIVHLIKGRNYYYPLPPAGWKVYGVGADTGMVEIQKLEISFIPYTMDPF